MRIKISEKNSKIGKIPNISLPPGASCVPGIPCFTDGCYAYNAYNRYPNVRDAWDYNLAFYQANPNMFFNEFDSWLLENNPELFRMFVGGDFPDEDFSVRLQRIVSWHPGTKFLVFTKRYDYDFSQKPDNLQVVLSTWPGVPLPTNHDLPWSWLEEDTRRPLTDYYYCQGGCDHCGHKCWKTLDNDIHVVFSKH